ncbi:protein DETOXIFICATION 49-like [Triticum dicoccoides]|nr:protein DETOXIFICATION 49-like [Triticum dicoccoides]XP_044428030.1 protein DETOXIFICATION 49-like [Triticum aestivum]
MCHCSQQQARCVHEALLQPPVLHDRPKKARGGGGGGASAEVASIVRLAVPMVGAGLLMYARSLVSMIFLGRLGRLPLAGGSLALGFANITGYSVLSGLAAGMDPVCGQAFGAGRTSVLAAALRRTVSLLLVASIPVSLLWVAMHRILVATGQDPDIAAAAYDFIMCSLPDLLVQSFLHPIRVYLRAQAITLPITYAAAAALLLHVPINCILVQGLHLGIRGVALGAVCTNLNFLLFLVTYVYFSGLTHGNGGSDGKDGACLSPMEEPALEWGRLVRLSIHSCMSVCLEWWWYEIMVMLCGVLADPKAAVAAMGILIQTTSLVYIFPHSLSCAVSTRVGHELGAGRPERARLAARVGLACGAALGLVACAFAASVRGVWARMFTADAAILRLTSVALPILGAAELGNCPQTAGCGVLRGSARPGKAARINASAFYGVGMPAALALAFWPARLDFRGMWAGMLAAQLVCAALMLRAVQRTDWEDQAVRARELTGAEAHGDVKSCHADADRVMAGNGLLVVTVLS